MRGQDKSLTQRSFVLSACFVLAGLLAYVLMAVAKRSLSAEEFSRFSVFWSFGFFLTASVGAPVEQELSRSVAYREAHGQRFDDVVRSATRLVGLLAAGAIVIALGAALSGRLNGLHANAPTTVALVLLLVGEAATSIVRGVLSGTRTTSAVGLLVAGQSGVRMLLVIVVVVLHPTSGLVAMAVAASSLTCLVFIHHTSTRNTGRLARSNEPGLSRSGVARLVAAAPFSAIFSVGTPALASVVSSDTDQNAIGDVLAALSLTSAPVLIAAALQTALLPSLVRGLVEGGESALRRTTRSIIAVVMSAAFLSSFVAAAIGPAVLQVLFGPTPAVGRWSLAAMTFAAGLLFLTNLLSPVCVARRSHGSVTRAWAVGALSMIGLILIPGDFANRVAIALVGGATVVVASVVLSLRSVWRRLPANSSGVPSEPRLQG